jgi:hypothetical protein
MVRVFVDVSEMLGLHGCLSGVVVKMHVRGIFSDAELFEVSGGWRIGVPIT